MHPARGLDGGLRACDGLGASDHERRHHADLLTFAARRVGQERDTEVGAILATAVTVSLGVHGDRLDAQLPAGTQDAQCDFAAIGDDDFV